MSRNDYEVGVLLADITGSTPLYEEAGDDAALRLLGDCLDRLRTIVQNQDGMFARFTSGCILALSSTHAAM